MKLTLTCMLGMLTLASAASAAEDGAPVEPKVEAPAKDPIDEKAGDPAVRKGKIMPKDLVDDAHVREELGVNEFTAPSISKLFDTLQFLMPLPILEVERKMPARMSEDRADLAI